MPTVTRAEREARIARDNGDLDEQVQLSSKGKAGARNHYHDDPGCRHFQKIAPENRTESTRGEAQERGCPPCTECVLGEESDGRSVGCTGHKSELEVLIETGQVPAELLGSGWSA